MIFQNHRCIHMSIMPFMSEVCTLLLAFHAYDIKQEITMATKQQAVAALAKHCPGAILEDESTVRVYGVQIEAPRGNHWAGDVHCMPIGGWYADGDKSEFWEMVIDEISNLPMAVPCVDKDCEGIAAFGECEYWSGDE